MTAITSSVSSLPPVGLPTPQTESDTDADAIEVDALSEGMSVVEAELDLSEGASDLRRAEVAEFDLDESGRPFPRPGAATVPRDVAVALAEILDLDLHSIDGARGAILALDGADRLSLLDEIRTDAPVPDEPAGRTDPAARQLFDLLGPSARTLELPTDPTLFLLALASHVAGVTRSESGRAIDENSARRADATEAARVARRRAAAAARRSRRLLARAPKWVRKLFSAITIAVGVVAAAFTGGASLGLAVAGAVLLLAAPLFQDLAVKLGMDPSKAKWVGFACRLAGAALMAGAGAAGGAGAASSSGSVATQSSGALGTAGATASGSTASATAAANASATAANVAAQAATSGGSFAAVVRQIESTVRLVQSLVSVADGTRTIAAAPFALQSERESIRAQSQDLVVDRLTEENEEVLDHLQRAIASFDDLRRRSVEMLDVERNRDRDLLARLDR